MSQCILSYAPVSPKRVLEILNYDENIIGPSKRPLIIQKPIHPRPKLINILHPILITDNVGASKATAAEVCEARLVRPYSRTALSFVFTSFGICAVLRFWL